MNLPGVGVDTHTHTHTSLVHLGLLLVDEVMGFGLWWKRERERERDRAGGGGGETKGSTLISLSRRPLIQFRPSRHEKHATLWASRILWPLPVTAITGSPSKHAFVLVSDLTAWLQWDYPGALRLEGNQSLPMRRAAALSMPRLLPSSCSHFHAFYSWYPCTNTGLLLL